MYKESDTKNTLWKMTRLWKGVGGRGWGVGFRECNPGGVELGGLVFRVQGLELGVQSYGFGIEGSGFGVRGSGFRVWGLGFRI